MKIIQQFNLTKIFFRVLLYNMDLFNRLTDFKCNVATAIITVLIFMLLAKWFPQSYAVGRYELGVPLLNTTEFAILLAAVLGYWVNGRIFTTCAMP